MWQVFLYLANERQVRDRQVIHARPRTRRWHFGRRASVVAARPIRNAAKNDASGRMH
jgi:hypothetical protein